MARIDLSIVLLCSLVALLNSHVALALVDPDMRAFGGSSNSQFTLEQCQNDLSNCKMLKNNHGSPPHNEVLDQMRQVVGSWMYLAGMHKFELPPGDKKSVSLTLTLTDVDLKTINTFLNYHTYTNFISMVPALNRLFTLKTSDYLEINEQKSEKIMKWKEKWVQVLFNVIMSCMNKETMLVATCLIMGFVIVKAMIFGANPRMLLSLFLMGVFFAGFLWNWAYMYQKAVVDQHVKRLKYEKYASSCQIDDSFWGFFKNLFGYHTSMDECTEYFRGVQIDPLIMVPPTVALSETLAMFIVHPAELMANSMHKITRILFGNMVWGTYIGTPIVMLVFGTIFLTLLILITGRRIRMKINFLGCFEVGSQFENFIHRPSVFGVEREMIEDQKPERIGYQRTNSNVQEENENASNPYQRTNRNVQEENVSNPFGNDNQQENLAPNCAAQPSNHETSICGGHTCCSAERRSPCRSQPAFQCTTRHCEPRKNVLSDCYFPEDSNQRFSPRSFSRENSGNLLRNRRSGFASGNSNRQQPFTDVTDRWTNDNLNDFTRGWTDKNRGEIEEVIYARRRKLSI